MRKSYKLLEKGDCLDFALLHHSPGTGSLLSSASLCCSFRNSLNRRFKLIVKTTPVLINLFQCFDRNALTSGGRGGGAREREIEECARRDSGMPTVSSNVAVAFSVHCRALHHRWGFSSPSMLL